VERLFIELYRLFVTVKVKPSFLAIAADMAAYPTIGPQPILSARAESSLCNQCRNELNDGSVRLAERLG
jgi:hypothetical protein